MSPRSFNLRFYMKKYRYNDQNEVNDNNPEYAKIVFKINKNRM